MNFYVTVISRSFLIQSSQKEMLPLTPQPAASALTVDWPDLPNICQNLSHWHLTKKHLLAGRIRVLQLHSKTPLPNHFLGTEIRSNFRCYSDCQVTQSPNPGFIKHGTHWSLQNDQYYLWQTVIYLCASASDPDILKFIKWSFEIDYIIE